MADFAPFYMLTHKDQDRNMPGLYLKKPKIVALVQHDLLNAASKPADHMKYFRIPASKHYPLDLNAGYESYIKRPDDSFKNKTNKVEFYIMNQSEWYCSDEDDEEDVNKEVENCTMERDYKVVTHRGCLVLLMEVPYQVAPIKWSLFATQYNRTLYLTILNQGDTSRGKNSSYHFKFHQYCFADDPLQEVNTKVPVDESKQVYSISKTKLLNLNLLYSSEISGIRSEQKIENLMDMNDINQSCFVHTKLLKESSNKWIRNQRYFDLWIKSYLLGVNDVYVGLKTDAGLVEQPITHMAVNQLPYKQKWLPKVCVTFMHTFVTKVIEEMRGIDCPYTTFEFMFDSKQRCIKFRAHHGKTEHSFLSDDFVQYLLQEAFKK